jgi:predicted dehydrogenase
MVGYQLRFHPCLERLRSILNAETIGNILSVRAVVGEHLPSWHRYEDYRGMYAARADLGGGVVLSQIHELDYLYSLFGTPRRVFALGGHASDLEIDVEDVASAIMDFRWQDRPVPVHLQLDYLQYPPCRQCEIVGDKGKVIMDLVANEVVLYANCSATPERFTTDGFERNNLFLDELRHFVECVKTRQQPVVTLEDGVQSLRIALAIKESIATGTISELESVEQAATFK